MADAVETFEIGTHDAATINALQFITKLLVNPAKYPDTWATVGQRFNAVLGKSWQKALKQLIEMSDGTRPFIKVAIGTTGNVLTMGSGSPTGGADGDFHFKTADGTFWSKAGGTWSQAAGVSVHANLSGKDADDHPHYTRADGTRAFTGAVSGVTPTAGAHLTTRDYVDAKFENLKPQDSVIDRDLTAPPGGELTGDRYIVAAGATGTWATHDNEIAEWNGSGYDFTVPTLNMYTPVDDEARIVRWNGSAWVFIEGMLLHDSMGGLTAGDPHTQYAKTNGSRNITGKQIFENEIELSAASASATIGSGGGEVDINLRKGNANSVDFHFYTDTGSGLHPHWIWSVTSAEAVEFKRRNADGTANDVPLSINWTTGDVKVANNLDLDGQAYFGDATATVSANAVAVDFNNGNMIEFDMQPATGTVTATLSNLQSGGVYYVIVKEHDDGVGVPYPITFSITGTVVWDTGTQRALSNPAEDKFTIYKFVKRGTYVFASVDFAEVTF